MRFIGTEIRRISAVFISSCIILSTISLGAPSKYNLSNSSDLNTFNEPNSVKTLSPAISLDGSGGKTEPTIYTQEMRDNALENTKKYQWAHDLEQLSVMKAERYLDRVDQLWSMVPSQSLPRSISVGLRFDPNMDKCRCCEVNFKIKYSTFPWDLNPLSDPWKIQCPNCKRRFPSNDFGSFYELGMDENGLFNYDLAHAENKMLIATGRDGYLRNDLYPEMGEGWGVDDGFGYDTGNIYGNGVKEIHTYIAYYNHYGLWYPTEKSNYGTLTSALDTLRDAYLYTGDAKYGRIGAILLDRIADIYPDYDLSVYANYMQYGAPTTVGKITVNSYESTLAESFVRAYDAFFPMTEDSQVISFLSSKAAQLNLENPKTSALMLRQNCENNILREIYEAVKTAKIYGLLGTYDKTLALAAVCLDSAPETDEWINFIMKAGSRTGNTVTGGNLLVGLMDSVSHDGHGIEVAPGCTDAYFKNVFDIASISRSYSSDSVPNLYQHPKFMKMFSAMEPLIIGSKYTAQIGDSGYAAHNSLTGLDLPALLNGFRETGNALFARLAYLLNGNRTTGLHEDIFTKYPEKISGDIMQVINQQGSYNPDSEMLTGYGYSVLRNEGFNDIHNDFWMYYGRNTLHGHRDTLNIGFDAFGLNFAPDLGRPETLGNDAFRYHWLAATLSHNTVLVYGDADSGPGYAANDIIHGKPMHFDDTEWVKLTDVDAPEVFDSTDIYRRTVVNVKVDEAVDYSIDFFRIRGGDNHIYSFHSQSDEVYETTGLNLVPQTDYNGNYIGTYAGPEIPFGADPNAGTNPIYSSTRFPRGFTWLDKVNRASSPNNTFSVDFKIKDFRRVLPYTLNLHLRMTMLNDFPLTEVAIANGYPPEIKGHPAMAFKYVLAKRTGSNLDTLYTTVFEPYNGERYISSIESVPVEIISGSHSVSDTVRAVKVTHINGREDYIVYATNNSVLYKIDDAFNFRGFVGVYSVIDGQVKHRYINDGDVIGEISCTSAYTGTVSDFTRDLSLDNTITVALNESTQPEALKGRYVYIENDGERNAVYKIENAVNGDNGQTVLDIGMVTPIRSYIDNSDFSKGYVYNLSVNDNIYIPLSTTYAHSVEFNEVSPKQVIIGETLSLEVSAVSNTGREITYSAHTLPRGSTFDPATRVFTWTPDANQAGTNNVIIKATDGVSDAYLSFKIEVVAKSTFGISIGTSIGIFMDGQELTEIPSNGGRVNIKTEYVNNSPNSRSVTYIVTVTSNNRLLSATTVPYTFQPWETHPFETNADIAAGTEEIEIKVMLWSGLDKIIPLTEPLIRSYVAEDSV